MIRYWLTPEPDERADDKIRDINDVYQRAAVLASEGEVVISTDEMTGVQALQRKHPGHPLAPGRVERREFEYIRHGTMSFMVNFEVASGRVTLVSAQPTRTEDDFVAHIRRTIEAQPQGNCI